MSVPLVARGTRPRNRRQLIIDAAAELMYGSGYAHVSMNDIATAVNVRASALYRHFPGKQDVLAAVLLDQISSLREQLATSADLAAAALAHRRLGVLWLRELRNLEPARRGEITAAIDSVIDALKPRIAGPHRDLLAWCLLAVLISPSFHQVQLPGGQLGELLGELAASVRDATLPRPRRSGGTVARPQALVARSRREQILASAIELFAERGYLAIGIDDIGAACGMAGTSIYRHFATKADVLLAAMNRGAEWLRLDLNRTLAQTDDPAAGLRGLLGSYAAFVLEQTDLIEVMLGETSHLPEGERHRIRQTQLDYIAEWVHLLAAVHPGLAPAAARVRVQAAFTVINTVTRSAELRAGRELPEALVAVGARLLALPPDHESR